MSADPWCSECGMHRGSPCYMVPTNQLVEACLETSAALDASYVGKGLCREAIDRRRWDKLVEELGEAATEYGLFVGENPRKGGPSADLVPFLSELLDIAACALGAWVHHVETWGDDVEIPWEPSDVLVALTEQTCRKRTRLLNAIAAGSSIPGDTP